MKWLHNLLKGVSLTACLFVFQACYGTPPGYPEDFFDPETEVVSVQVARGKKAGDYTMMKGFNPVYVFTMQGRRADAMKRSGADTMQGRGTEL